MAFTHQYRFAAAESVSKDKVPRAISIILLGGIVSAFIGPSVANFSNDLFSNHIHRILFITCSVNFLTNNFLFSFIKIPQK